MKIAVLITCFNRKEKTMSCIKDICQQDGIQDLVVDIYVVDGGSTDGTLKAIQSHYPQVNVSIHRGLYWAGGMRAAWKEALSKDKYDFYWLINDDTLLYKNCLQELLKADEYARMTFGKQGIYIGSTKDTVSKQFSYGGRKLKQWGDNQFYIVKPDGKSCQPCDLGNANIMLVSQAVYQSIGGFCERYTHGIADYDYTLRAVRAGCPVMVARHYCGECCNDHGNSWSSSSASLKERIDYLYSPKGLNYHEYLFFVKEFFPKQYCASKLKLWLKTLCPFIWDVFKS